MTYLFYFLLFFFLFSEFALFGNNSSMPPLFKPNGSITQNSKEKAMLLADVFDRKQGDESDFKLKPKLSNLAFRSSKIRKLLLELDS